MVQSPPFNLLYNPCLPYDFSNDHHFTLDKLATDLLSLASPLTALILHWEQTTHYNLVALHLLQIRTSLALLSHGCRVLAALLPPSIPTIVTQHLHGIDQEVPQQSPVL